MSHVTIDIPGGAGVAPPEVSQSMKQFEASRGMIRAAGGMGASPGSSGLRLKGSGHMEKKDRNKKAKKKNR